jgi:hypothetical protein
MKTTQYFVILSSVCSFYSYAATPSPNDQSLYYTPANYAKILESTYTPKFSISNQGIAKNRGRYLISNSPKTNNTANYLSIVTDPNTTEAYAVQSATLPAKSTYGTYFSKLIQVVANSSDKSGFYRLDAHLHPNYSIDAIESDGFSLKFRNNFGKTTSSYGYIVFSYDANTKYLRAEKRYAHHLEQQMTTDARGKSTVSYSPSFTEDPAFSVKGAGYYVSVVNGKFKLVPKISSATKLYFYNPTDNYDIPSRFNPSNVAYLANPAAPYPSKVSPDAVESGNNAFYTKINASYRPQVATAGNDAKTKLAADQFLANISVSLAAQGEKLRYPISLYTAFRDAALSGKLASASVADGLPGQKLVPFVYFTNEKDKSGHYHPFMNIVSYTIPGMPQGLLDVPGPPYLGKGSASTPVTRYSNLGYFLARIPMKDYGQVKNVTDNLMSPGSDRWALNLVTDSHCGEANSPISVCPAYDHYNYASTADAGILVDGSIIFPLLNNALMPSQWKGELSSYGCHVGQGGDGPHCHSDGFSTGQNSVTLYNDTDYVNKAHPPLIGFAYDGIALFGLYRGIKDSSMNGYSEALDDFGAHNHDGMGYHYHAHTAILPDSYTINSNGLHIDARSNPVNVLLKGAWAGNINAVPYFGYKDDFLTNQYLGGM